MRGTAFPALAFLLFAALLAAPRGAGAQERRFEHPKGFYFIAGGSAVLVKGSANGLNQVLAAQSSVGLPVVPVPYTSFHKAFGPGVGFIGSFGGTVADHIEGQVSVTGDYFDKRALSLQLYTGTAEIKVSPQEGRVNPYLLGGIGVALGQVSQQGGPLIEDTNWEFTFTVGGGVEFYLSEAVAIVPEVRMRYFQERGDKLFPVHLGVSGRFTFE